MEDLFAFIAQEKEKESSSAHDENLAKLTPGDVCFYDSAYHHSFMYLGTVYGQEHCKVHARSGEIPHGIYIDKMSIKDTTWTTTTFFHCKNAELRAEAINFARIWALNDPALFKESAEALLYNEKHKGLASTFSMERYGKLVEPDAAAQAFTARSLMRALKYASRRAQPLSREKGTTCTAFLIACYQAAFLWICTGGSTDLLAYGYEKVKGMLAEPDGELKYDADTVWFELLSEFEGKYVPIRKLMAPSLQLESKTANAGSPWKDLIAADHDLWEPVPMRKI